MIRHVRAEAGKFGKRRSLQALLAMAIVLVPLFHLSMQREVRYQRGLNQETLRITRAAFDQKAISPQEYAHRVTQIRRDGARLANDARSLSLPGALQTGLQTFMTGSMLFIVLAASLAFGSEFGWATYRNLVVLRQRSRVFVAQTLGFLILVAIALLLSLVIASVLGILYSGTGAATPAAIQPWRGIGTALGGAVLAACLWSLIGQLSALVAKSAGVAVATASLVWIVLTFASFLLPLARPWNIDSSAAALSLVESSRLIHGLFLPSGIDTQQLPGVARASAQLGLTGIIVLLVNRTRFTRMDIP